jgi:hypothetical protein
MKNIEEPEGRGCLVYSAMLFITAIIVIIISILRAVL